MSWRSFLISLVWLLAAGTSVFATDELPVADIYFKGGSIEKQVAILSRTDSKIKCRLSYGEVTYSLAVIEKIDPPNAGLKEAPAAGSISSVPAPASTAEAAPSVAAAEPAATAPAADPAAPATGENDAPASPSPAAPQETAPPAEPAPAAAVAPEPPETRAAEAAGIPAPPPASDSAAEPATPERKYSAAFDVRFVIWLLLAAVWMRSVQWVQGHLASRKVDPKLWTLAALLLPGAGAAAYAGVMKLSGQDLSLNPPAFARREPARPAAAALPAKPQSTRKMPSGDGRRDQDSNATASAEKQQQSRASLVELRKKNRTAHGFEFIDVEKRFAAAGGDPAAGLKMAGEMIDGAIFERASDVHIEPALDDCRIRFRLDGLLQERMRFAKGDASRVLAALKTMAELDPKEEFKPQEGRFQMRCGDHRVDLRVATTSSFHGEKLVIRLLDHGKGGFDLASLGFDEKSLETFAGIIQSRDGAILATGPGGSGRTSTLYAAIRTMDAGRLNIMTIEDPPEYELEGTTQLSVNLPAGITCETGLQSILRQDPDVILIGEIRDSPTMKIALSAALDGHLVMGVLQAQKAVSAITLLREMGIENFQIASAIRMILCQRLVRVLCPHCRHPFPARGTELAPLGMELEPGSILHAATGCERCMDTGYSGRTALFEMLVVDEALRKAIVDGADEPALAAVAARTRFHSYQFNGAQKVLAGITTVEELLQTAKPSGVSGQ